MELKNQVCSLKLAKELKENGYLQEGLWWWALLPKSSSSWVGRKIERTVSLSENVWKLVKHKMGNHIEKFAAPTVAELGERLLELRNEFAQGWNDSGCYWHFQTGGRGSGAMIEGIGQTFTASDDDTEANARAKMWLYLKKNELIKGE